jgi:small subunit ribosomal protein S11e
MIFISVVGLSIISAGLRRSKGKGSVRYFKNVGLGFKTPTEAKEGTYVDKSCPFTSSISIRGRIMKGGCMKHSENTVTCLGVG